MPDIVSELRASAMPDTHVGDCMVRAADEIERLRYVLEGVRAAIKTGRNEPLQVWKDQIEIALSPKEPE